MKELSLVIILLVTTSSYASTGSSSGSGDGDPLVKISGSLSPDFKMPLKIEEFQAIKSGLNGLGNLKPIEIDVNDLMMEEDKPAIKEASQLISDIFVDATKRIVMIQVMAYRYAAVMRVEGMGQYFTALHESYQKESEELYQQIIAQFVKNHRYEFQSAISKCKSEVCVGRIALAEKELMDFGFAINKGVCVGCSESVGLPTFKSDLTQYVLAESYRQISEKADSNDKKLVAQSFAAFSSQTDKAVDLTMMINIGISKVEKSSPFYFLNALDYTNKEIKKLQSDQYQYANATIAAKIKGIANPGLSHSEGMRWLRNGIVDRGLLEVDGKDQVHYFILVREAKVGIGRCVLKEWGNNIMKKGIRLIRDYEPSENASYKYKHSGQKKYKSQPNGIYLNVTDGERSAFVNFDKGVYEAINELMEWIKEGKCDPK